jgi:hypothetical protein
VAAEFAGTQRAHALAPAGFVPRPVAVGRYSSLDAHFVVTEFVDMDLLAPANATDAVKEDLVRNLIALHKRSAALAREAPPHQRLFGTNRDDPPPDVSHLGRDPAVVAVSFNGAQPCETLATTEWDRCFAHLLRYKLALDCRVNLPWGEFDRAAAWVLARVVPRLLSPAHLGVATDGEDDGHEATSTPSGPVLPTYIHGDLYDNNIGVRKSGPLKDDGPAAATTAAATTTTTTTPPRTVIIDINGYHAHNEMDLAGFVSPYTNVARALPALYAKLGGDVASPRREFSDRLRLYSLVQMLNYSAGHPGSGMRES